MLLDEYRFLEKLIKNNIMERHLLLDRIFRQSKYLFWQTLHKRYADLGIAHSRFFGDRRDT